MVNLSRNQQSIWYASLSIIYQGAMSCANNIFSPIHSISAQDPPVSQYFGPQLERSNWKLEMEWNPIRICCIVRLHRGLEKLGIHDFGYGQFNKLLVCVIAQWRPMKMNPHMKYVIWCGSRTQCCKIASMQAVCEQNQQWNNIFGHAEESCANSMKSVLNIPFKNKKKLGSNN